MKTVIIDDGIYEKKEGTPKVKQKLFVNEQEVFEDSEEIGAMTHGSMCAEIIYRLCSEMELISIRMINSRGKGFLKDLLCALQWCLDHNIKLVHMSIGSTRFQADRGCLLNNKEIAFDSTFPLSEENSLVVHIEEACDIRYVVAFPFTKARCILRRCLSIFEKKSVGKKDFSKWYCNYSENVGNEIEIPVLWIDKKIFSEVYELLDTQKQLANQLNSYFQAISRWEKGVSHVKNTENTIHVYLLVIPIKQ